MQYEPLKLTHVTKSPIWGGVRLLRDWRKSSDASTIGESWELTVRKQEMSCVTGGDFDGRTVWDIIESDPKGMLGQTKLSNGAFPLLIKLIDSADRLSVQVHPDDVYAARVERDRGKTEMWYIVEADEGAEIICGLLPGVSAKDYADAVLHGDFEGLLLHRSVHAGEVYFIPAGLPHAIGKGILIAEIQQNCDLTYRVYDYDRKGPDGSPRPLHIQKALDVIRPFTEEKIRQIQYARTSTEADNSLLADCTYFSVRKLECIKETDTVLEAFPYLRHLLCLGGTGELRVGGKSFLLQKGDSYLLPASLPELTLSGNVTCLVSLAY